MKTQTACEAQGTEYYHMLTCSRLTRGGSSYSGTCYIVHGESKHILRCTEEGTQQKQVDLGVHVRWSDVTFHDGHVSSGMWPAGPLSVCVCLLAHVAVMCCGTARLFTLYPLPGSKSKPNSMRCNGMDL